MNLRKKLIAFDEGMSVYCNLEKDEEVILIPFSFSFYVTVRTIRALLYEYIADLDRNECKEVLSIDFEQMTNVDYWMKNGNLKRDMEALSTKSLKEHGFDCTLMGYKPATTMDLYLAIETLVVEITELLKTVDQKIEEAPITLYGNFYRFQKSFCDRHPAEVRHKRFRKDAGVLTDDILKDRRASEIENYLKMKILHYSLPPSDREVRQIDLGQINKHLSYGYVIPEKLKKCYARFWRYVKEDGDTLKIDYNLYGNYLFQHYYELTPAERQAFFELDIMLELINRDMASLKAFILPTPLATPEAMVLWQKLMEAGYVTTNYQPTGSRTEAAVLAYEMAKKLSIREKWKLFEELWNRKNMRGDYNDALNQRKTLEFLDKLKVDLAD